MNDKFFNRSPQRFQLMQSHMNMSIRLGMALVTLALLSLGSARASPPPAVPPETDSPPVNLPDGIHYQALTSPQAESIGTTDGSSRPEASVYLARPPLDNWDSVRVTSDSDCLVLGSLEDPGPGHVLVQLVQIDKDAPPEPKEASEGPTSGESCGATVSAHFTWQTSTWQTSTQVRLYWAAAPQYPYENLTASLSVSRIGASSREPTAAPPRVLFLELKLHNLGGGQLEFIGLADPQGIEASGGFTYLLPAGRYIGTVRELQTLGGASGVLLGPDESMRVGIVFDPEGTLAKAAGTLTVQPAILVRRDDKLYSVIFNRVSTSWGEDLP